MIRQFVWVLVGCVWLQSPLSAAETEKLPEVVEFNRDIRPILSENCFFCHGPDKNKREAKLRLDTEAGLLGSPETKGVVRASRPAESELYRRIISADADLVMPPAASNKHLSDRDKELIKRWIDQGAKYEGHWAFLPIKRPAVPTKNLSDEKASNLAMRNEIDAFVRDELSAAGVAPSSEADRVTLIRRLSFDLIGLPPTPEDVTAFVNDSSKDAYEHVVDRLLASPHFGERLAVWWLDLVRYADSVGYHGDQDVSVSPFRQYVIESFNANKRFDQFTVEQLAGDLLPNPTTEQRIASGYNRLGMMSAEGGVQDKEYLAKYIAERVRNASGTWLGVTLGCAECHDHKYDPFTAKDFYRFEAFFADIEERGLYSGANADGSWGKSIKVPTELEATELAKLDQRIAATKTVLNTSTPRLVAAQAEWEKTQTVWTVVKPESINSLNGTTFTTSEDGSILAGGVTPPTETYTLQFANLMDGITGIRLEVLPDNSLPAKGPGRAPNGNFVLTEIGVKSVTAQGDEQQVGLQNPQASFEQTGASEGNPYGKWAIAAAIDGDVKGKSWGWAVLEKVGQPQTAVFETVAPISAGTDRRLTLTLAQNLDNSQHTIGRFRVSVTRSAKPVRLDLSLPANVNDALQIAVEQRSEEQRKTVAAYYRSISPVLDSTRRLLARYEAERKELDAKIASTLITASVTPRMVRVLNRGNWMDESGEAVTPAYPAILAVTQPTEARLTRLDLARWLTAPENPLTSRVFVNRVWKLFFGAGLSRRVDDLGAQGEPPSHPLLLDHLAGRFIDSGWNVKGLVKSIVMSETYRQTSKANSELRERDPHNRLLARQGRFRLDAEFVRDNALAVSGLLVTKVGGISVKPYQPPGYWAYLNFPAREWQNGNGDQLYRRGLYTHWQRQYLHPSMQAFDAPSREECTADRPRSNTPLQSLVLLNDPSYVEAARAFAEQILRHGGSANSDRLKYAFRRATSREISEPETKVLEGLLQKHLAEFRADQNAAKESQSVGARPVPTDLDLAEVAAWTSVARTILNLHETITRN